MEELLLKKYKIWSTIEKQGKARKKAINTSAGRESRKRRLRWPFILKFSGAAMNKLANRRFPNSKIKIHFAD
jgi:hypothetical protein